MRDFINYYLGYILISLFYVCIRFYFPEKPIEVSVGYIQGSITINFRTMVKILASYVKLMFLAVSSECRLYDCSCPINFDAFITSLILLAAAGIIIFKTIQRITSLPVPGTEIGI